MIRRERIGEAVAVTFILPADHPNAPVSVVGDFNDWSVHRHPLVRRGDGRMSTTVILAPGVTAHFRYLGTDGAWFDDPDADYITDQGSFIKV